METSSGKLFVVSGPSGAGKSTLCRLAVEKTGIFLSISATTRPAGKNECDGRDYHFLDQAAFEKKIREGAFLEYARVFDHYYGTPAEPVHAMLRTGRPVLLEIDVQGAAQVFARTPQAVGILVLPPDEAALKQRLAQRGRDDESVQQKRLARAQREIQQAQASPHYLHTIINRDLEVALRELIDIVTR